MAVSRGEGRVHTLFSVSHLFKNTYENYVNRPYL